MVPQNRVVSDVEARGRPLGGVVLTGVVVALDRTLDPETDTTKDVDDDILAS
jgi:hypothetical protein